MRKAISVIFFILFLISLRGLTAGFRIEKGPGVLVGECIFSFVLLMIGLYFWRPAKAKE